MGQGKMSLSETRIQNRLYFDLWQGAMMIVPNYTPGRWWECDLWHVTKAGYGVEHEIKLTRADFKKDAQKAIRRVVPKPDGKGYMRQATTKYDLLASGDTSGPCRFYYVVPVGLLKEAEIPEWAGWKEVEERHKGLVIVTRKDAPMLHKTKVDSRILAHARGVFYYRYWHLRNVSPTPDVIAAIEPHEERDAGLAVIGPPDVRALKAEEFNLFTEAI